MNLSLTLIRLDSGLILLVGHNEYFNAPILKWDSLDEFAEFLQDAQEFFAEARYPIPTTILRSFNNGNNNT